MKLGELASRLGAELRGDAEPEVTGVKGIEEAGPTEITFVANPRYTALARTTQAAAVLVEPEFPGDCCSDAAASRTPTGLLPRAGNVLPAAGLRAGDSSDRGDRPYSGDWRGCAYWRICCGGAPCAAWSTRNTAAACGALSGSAGGQPLFCPCSCGGARVLHAGRPCDA